VAWGRSRRSGEVLRDDTRLGSAHDTPSVSPSTGGGNLANLEGKGRLRELALPARTRTYSLKNTCVHARTRKHARTRAHTQKRAGTHTKMPARACAAEATRRAPAAATVAATQRTSLPALRQRTSFPASRRSAMSREGRSVCVCVCVCSASLPALTRDAGAARVQGEELTNILPAARQPSAPPLAEALRDAKSAAPRAHRHVEFGAVAGATRNRSLHRGDMT